VFLKKVVPQPSQLKSATLGKQFVIEKCVKGHYGIHAWLILAINREKKARRPDVPTSNKSCKGQILQARSKSTNYPGGGGGGEKYGLVWRVVEEH
jgi:hypothetical protein